MRFIVFLSLWHRLKGISFSCGVFESTFLHFPWAYIVGVNGNTVRG